MAYSLHPRIMIRIVLILSFLFILLKSGRAEIYKCIESAKKFEKIYKLPENLLVSMALTESGRMIKSGKFIAWPWTINVRGKGKFFDTKKNAINYVKKYTKNGKKNIDIGCMQVNHMYHPKAFTNLERAFDPETNVEWSANLIKNLYQKYGSYKEAVGYYHSYRPVRKNQYSSKVFKTWRKLNKNNSYANIQIKFNNELKADFSNHDKEFNVTKEDNQHTEKIVRVIKEESITKNISNNKTKKVNSDYIIARMEKVKFFREYFLK